MVPLSLAFLLVFAPFTRSALQPAVTNWNSSSVAATTPPLSLTTQSSDSCPCDFDLKTPGLHVGAWSALKVTTTLTAATVVYVVNNRTNTTRTTTITNILPSGYTLPPTNSDGTAVKTLTGEYPPGTAFTSVLAFPTGYVYYDYGVSFRGHMRVTTASHVQCVTAGDQGSFTMFPSPLSPQFPKATIVPHENEKEASKDTDGLLWTMLPYNDPQDIDIDRQYFVNYRSVYPSFPAFLPQCTLLSTVAWSPMLAAGAAKFLTDTSTSHEDTGPTSSAQAMSSSIQRSAVASALSAPTATSTPRTESSARALASTANAGGRVSSSLGAAASVTQRPSAGNTAPAGTSSKPESMSDSSKNAPPAGTSDVRTPSAAPAATPAATPPAPASSPSSSTAQANVPPTSASIIQAPPAAAPISVGNSALSISAVTVPQAVGASSSSVAFVIGSQTAALGQTVTVQNTPVAVHTSNGQTAVAVGGTETTLPAAPVPGETSAAAATAAAAVPSPFSLNGQTISVNSESAYVVGAQTLAPGRPVTVGSGSSTAIVALTTNSAGQSVVVVGSSSSVIPAATGGNSATAAAVPSSLVIGGQTISANSASAYVVGSQTLAPGNPVTLGSGSATTVVALTTNSAGQSVIIVGSSSSVLSTPNGGGAAAAATASASAVAIAGHTVSANSASAYLIEGQTLKPGAPVTLGSGSAAATALLTSNSAGQSVIVVGSSTALLPIPAGGSASAVAVAGHPISVNSASAYVIEGQTLKPGTPVTLGSGSAAATALLTSNSAGQSVVVVDSSTALLPALAGPGPTTGSGANSTQGIGTYTVTRLGGSQTTVGTVVNGGTPSGRGSATSAVPTGGGNSVRNRGETLWYGAVLAVGFLFVFPL